MSIRMVHPIHGVTHAVGAEVDWNRANGWRVEESAPAVVHIQEEKAAEVADEIIEQSLAERYEAKFRKKPHHRMLPETIEAALAE